MWNLPIFMTYSHSYKRLKTQIKNSVEFFINVSLEDFKSKYFYPSERRSVNQLNLIGRTLVTGLILYSSILVGSSIFNLNNERIERQKSYAQLRPTEQKYGRYVKLRQMLAYQSEHYAGEILAKLRKAKNLTTQQGVNFGELEFKLLDKDKNKIPELYLQYKERRYLLVPEGNGLKLKSYLLKPTKKPDAYEIIILK